LAALSDFPQLLVTDEAARLAEKYLAAGCLPSGTDSDALHIALASISRVNFLVTWNLRHIAGEEARMRLESFHEENGLWYPELCTPEAFLQSDET
jgi:hypothetical protein